MQNNKRSIFNYFSSLLSILLKKSTSNLLVMITIGLGIGIGNVLINTNIENNSTPPTVQINPFTRAEYERLKLGMSIVQVESILDRGTEIKQSTKTVTFVWKNPNGSKIIVIFENNKLIEKRQEGL